MTTKLSQWKRIALVAAGVSVSMASTASAGSYALYELHSTGSIWGYTGTPCAGGVCKGWVELDDNPAAQQIVAGGGLLFQKHTDGVVWEFTGTPCSGGYCTGWKEIDNEPTNSVTGIYGAGGALYEQRADQSVWVFTGQACSGGNCPGWRQLDNSLQIVNIFGAASGLFETRAGSGGQGPPYSFWEYSGTPCSGNLCPGWAEIDTTGSMAGQMAVGTHSAYALDPDQDLRQFTGQACANNVCPGWLSIDNNPYSITLAAANNLYLLQQPNDTNAVWEYNGTPCNGNVCNGWVELDSNPAIASIIAGGNTVYEQHYDGSVWQSTGQPCGSAGCPGWIELDNNSLTKRIVAN